MRELLKDFLPPIAARAYRSVAGRAFGFRGDYANWTAARAASLGYDADEVISRTRDAALKVVRGEAKMDRDTVAFGDMDYAYPTLAGLLRAARTPAELSVLDIGGSLGNVYRQFRAFAPRFDRLNWRIVEQPALVAVGREHFESEELRFFANVADALNPGHPDVILLSSALQYFESPYELVTVLGGIRGAGLVIDRTPCAEAERDVLTVQSVPAEIYRGSYPCWIFSRTRLEAALTRHYAEVASFRDPAGPLRGDGGTFELRGYLLDARS
jgi:putative methyltransferase (TIGR04325 family)